MAYGTDSGLQAYASDRGLTITGTPSHLLNRAHDYLEALDFIGQKNQDDQANQWPRKYAYVDGVLLDEDTVPQAIIDAEYTIALAIDAGNDPAAVITPAIKAERVDVLSIEYQDGQGNRSYDPMIGLKLRKYIRPSSASANVMQVGRA